MLCDEHAPLEDARCDECESEFLALVRRPVTRPANRRSAMAIAVTLSTVAASAAFGLLWVSILLGLIAMLLAVIFIADSGGEPEVVAPDESKLRRAFLAERSKLIGTDAPPEQ